MSTLTDAKLRQLPKPIVDKLQSLIARARRLMLIRGLFATLAVALVCILIIMGIDAAVTLFSDTLRWALSLTGLAITGLAAFYFLVRPLSRRLGLTRIARVIETRHPELQERISTAVELMASDDPDSIRGSQELIEEVVNSAVIDVADVSPEQEFQPARSRRPMFVVASIAIFLLLLAAIFPRHVGVLFARAVAPFLDIGNAYANTLVVKPGDIRVPIGSPVTVDISIQNDKIRRAELRLSTTTTTGEKENARPRRSEETVERMTLLNKTADGTQSYQLRFPSVEESFDYRIRAGAAVSEYFTITAVPTPEIEELQIGYDFPDYTQLKSTESVSDNGDIRAVAHTRVSVTASANKAITSAKLLVGDRTESIAEAEIDGDQASWEFDLTPGTESNWTIELEDVDGFNNDALTYQMVALDDATPQVTVLAPEARQLKLKPDEFLPIYFTVREDFGFREVHLFVKPDNSDDEWRLVQASPEPASMKRSESRFDGLWDQVQKFFALSERNGSDGMWRGDAPLDLSALDLEGVGKLTVRVIVEDNLPAELEGPNVGYSDAIVINLDKNAKSLVQQTVDNQLKEIQEAIRESRTEVDKANQKAREAERELAKEDQVNPEAQKDLEDLREHAENAAEKLRDTAERMKQTAFNQQAEQLEEVADEEVAAAQESADMIPLTDEKKERVAEAKNASKQLEQASKDLREIEQSLNEARQDAQLVAELNELANEQRQLAKSAQQQAQQEAQQQPPSDQAQAQQMTREQQQQLAEWQREQQQVQRELGEVLKDNEAALRDVLEQRQEQAAELSEQAKQLAEDQKVLRDLTEMAAKPEAQQSLREKLVANLQQEQQAIAEQTRELQAQTEQQQAQAQNASPEDPPATSPPSSAENAAQDPANQADAESESSADAEAAQASPQMAENADQASEPGDPQASTPDQGSDDPASTSTPSQPQAQQQEQQQAALAEASRQAEQAAQQLNQEDLAAAAESAQEAGQQLAQAQQQAEAQAESQAQAAEARAATEPSMAQNDSANAEESPAAEEQAAEAQAQAQAQAQTDPSSTPTGESPGADASEPTPPTTPSDPAAQAAQAAQAAAAQAASEASAATAEQLAQLSERQQQVAEQLEAIAGGQIDQALAEQEAQLADEAADLSQQSSDLQKATEMTQANARKPAQQATSQLDAGKRSADKANTELTQAQQAQDRAEQQPGQPAGEPAPQAQRALAQSQASQQDARNRFEQAARSLDQAAKLLEQQSQRLSEEEMDSPFLDSQDLSQSFQDVSDAATSPTSEQAAEQAQQAAQSLQQMAQAAMQQLGAMGNDQPPQSGEPGQQGQPGQQEAPPGMADSGEPQLGDGTRNPDADGSGVPPELEALGISIEDWAQMKGTLQSGRDTTGGGSTPAEYRDLVNRYFRVIANEAGAKP